MCPYAHAGEKARRRDPMCGSSSNGEPVYTGIACPSMKSVSRFFLRPLRVVFVGSFAVAVMT